MLTTITLLMAVFIAEILCKYFNSNRYLIATISLALWLAIAFFRWGGMRHYKSGRDLQNIHPASLPVMRM